MNKQDAKRLTEYGIYLVVLLGCIAGLYWRFWYRPPVNPVIMLDSSVMKPKTDQPKRLLLDPSFQWSLVRTETDGTAAYFQSAKDNGIIRISPGEKLGSWELKSVTSSEAIMFQNGEERVVYLETRGQTKP